jgi:hypothetical protein
LGTLRLSFISLLVVLAAPASGQTPGADTAQAAIYSGGLFSGFGTHPVVGGAFGIEFAKNALFFLDTSYASLNGDTLLRPNPPGVQNSRLFDFNANFQFSIPAGRRWAPYAILGSGALFSSYDVTQIDAAGRVVVIAHESTAKYAFQTGGGARFYVNESWGVQPEVKVFIGARSFARMSMGVFFNFNFSYPFLPGRNSRRGRSL